MTGAMGAWGGGIGGVSVLGVSVLGASVIRRVRGAARLTGESMVTGPGVGGLELAG